jgi:hypothetical protein
MSHPDIPFAVPVIPVKIWDMVLEDTPHAGLLSFRAACKAPKQVIDPHLFAVLRATSMSLANARSFLQQVKSRDARQYTRKIDFIGRMDDDDGVFHWVTPRVSLAALRGPDPGASIATHIRRNLATAFETIRSLSRLESVHIQFLLPDHMPPDPTDAQRARHSELQLTNLTSLVNSRWSSSNLSRTLIIEGFDDFNLKSYFHPSFESLVGSLSTFSLHARHYANGFWDPRDYRDVDNYRLQFWNRILSWPSLALSSSLTTLSLSCEQHAGIVPLISFKMRGTIPGP